MTTRFKMPPYDPGDDSSLQYALDKTEIFLNSQTAAIEGDSVQGQAEQNLGWFGGSCRLPGRCRPGTVL